MVGPESRPHKSRLIGRIRRSAHLARRPDEPAPATDRVGCECRHAHRDDRAFGAGKGPDRGQELFGAATVHDPEDGVAPLGEAQCLLAAVLGLLVALDQAATDQPVNKAARGRWRPSDRFGKLADRERAAVREDVQGRELGEAEP